MKWSVRIGTFAGIAVDMHATFLLLIAWVALSHWLEGDNLSVVLDGVAFILALFGCVLLHEFGHALTAQRFGIRTRDITLLPIGGVSRLERMPEEPLQELWVALAGPAVNVVIAGVLYAGLHLAGAWQPIEQLGMIKGSFAERLMLVNGFLAAFNLLPAFPMDGGRVVRALLATRMDYARATRAAASLGQAMALLFAFAGFFANPFLLFIALFVWIGAGQEAGLAQVRSVISGIPVTRAMLTNFVPLAPGDSLARAVELILAGSQQDFPVVENRRVVGILLRSDLVVALAQRDQSSPVSEVMRRGFQTVEATEMLESALSRLTESDCPMLPVTRDGDLVGLVTMENVGEFVMIQAALKPRRQLAPAA